MSYIGKKPVDFNDVTEAQTFTVTGDLTVTSADINGGTIDGVTIGGTTAGAGTFTGLTVAGTVGAGASSTTDAIYQRAQAVSGTYFTMLHSGTGLTGVYPDTVVDSTAGSHIRLASGDITNDFSGTVDICAYGKTGVSTANYISFSRRIGVDTINESMRIDSSGNVGIGTSSPSTALHVVDSGNPTITLSGSDSAYTSILDLKAAGGGGSVISANGGSNALIFTTSGSEAMRIDSSGNLLVGTTTVNPGIGNTATGVMAGGTILSASRSGNVPAFFNRNTSDGNIVQFSKDGTTVGSIGSSGGVATYLVLRSDSSGMGITASADRLVPTNNVGVAQDNVNDLGKLTFRWNDIYATNGTIITSDANEKQQIASLTDAEMTAAKRISNGFKTFKWNDAVAAKGDNARTHTGVIAQEVRAALEAEGLDAGDYAFFISTTWWETTTDVPAVAAVEAQDAVYDDDGNIVTEAVEAVEARDAYTRTDTYDTAEEAPEGATERTRLGIRYPELLAFVGAATEQRLTHLETLEARIVALENT